MLRECGQSNRSRWHCKLRLEGGAEWERRGELDLSNGSGHGPQEPRAAPQQASLEKVLGKGSAWNWGCYTQVERGKLQKGRRSPQAASTMLPQTVPDGPLCPPIL